MSTCASPRSRPNPRALCQTNVNWTPVKSTNLARAAYDADTRTLAVEFTNGRVYTYADVPAHVYGELVSAESAGKYFFTCVRDMYAAAEVANRAVATIEAFLKRYPDAERGAAHIVLADYNLDDESIDECIEQLQRQLETPECRLEWMTQGHHPLEVDATITLLRELRVMPENERLIDDEEGNA